MKKTIIGLVLSMQLMVFSLPGKEKKAAFDSQAAFDYIKVLAADDMQGRKSGEPGGRMAADYVVSKLKEWGLEPAGPKGSYFQEMTYEYYEPAKGASLGIITDRAKREFVYGEDWRQQAYSGSGNFTADIVFVGYGISAPQKEYDDYAGVDVKDKLVLFSTDTPGSLGDKLKDEAQFPVRIKAAQEHGAHGVLTFRSATQQTAPFAGFRGGLKKESYKPDFVIVSLETKIVDFIFKHLKTELRYLFQQIDTTSKPQSFDTGVRSSFNLGITFDEKRPVQNVVAKISGVDRKLKNEYVILGAHMDHLGIDMSGDVFNGADDNASGTAVVMEVARTMKLNRIKPRRTIVFALWAAEEEGLHGSKFFTNNPLVPLEKTVCYINLDMEGHGNGKIDFAGVYYAPEIWELLKARLPKAMVENVITGRGGPGGSDHSHFHYKGVPAFQVGTDGPHFKTNRVGDVLEMIKPEVLKKSGDFVEAAVTALANEPKIPVVAQRQADFFWKYERVVDYQADPLPDVIAARGNVKDPDVDFQLTVVGEKEGLSGDALRMEVMKNLLTGLEKIAQTKGLVRYESTGTLPMMMRFRLSRQPGRTTVLIGLQGISCFRDDLRWAEVFSKQGVAFVLLDQPRFLFGEKGLNDEGKKILEATGRANLLLIASAFDANQVKALLNQTKKPLFLEMSSIPDKEVLDLVKKTGSAVGLVLDKNENATLCFKKIDEAKKAIGTEYIAVISGNRLWDKPGKEQMLGLLEEMLKAKYEIEDLANLFSATFMRVLERARSAQPAF